MMKGLSLYQPWASLVAIEAKKIETRSWHTKYRGPLAIASSKKFNKGMQLLCNQEPFRTALLGAGPKLRHFYYNAAMEQAGGLPLGEIVAVCDLDGISHMDDFFVIQNLLLHNGKWEAVHEPERSFGEYSFGRFAWWLKTIRQLTTPVPVKGAMGLWDVPAHIEAQILAQL